MDSLRFADEAEFPGFLKYDYPYVSRPTADRIRYRGESYVAYELQRFLIFPLNDGIINLRPIDCELKVRVPSGKFAAADLILDARRSSNALQLRVKPLPQPALVGSFVLKNEIVSDGPRSKVIRIALEGDGLLSTFDVPPLQAVDGQVRSSSTSTTSTIRGQKLFSRKTAEFEVVPDGNTTNIVLQPVQIPQFDPDRSNLTVLKLPPMALTFSSTPRSQSHSRIISDALSSFLGDFYSGCCFQLRCAFLQPVPTREEAKTARACSCLSKEKSETTVITKCCSLVVSTNFRSYSWEN